MVLAGCVRLGSADRQLVDLKNGQQTKLVEHFRPHLARLGMGGDEGLVGGDTLLLFRDLGGRRTRGRCRSRCRGRHRRQLRLAAGPGRHSEGHRAYDDKTTKR